MVASVATTDTLFDAEEFFGPRPVAEIALLDRPGTEVRRLPSTSIPDTGLLVAPCSRRSAEYAVLNWHYSRTMPLAHLVTLGVWEDGRYVGAVIFGPGATQQLGSPYGLTMTTCTELVRVALREHRAPVSRIVAQAIRLLAQTSPGLRLIVSFADPTHGHHGGIYQAGNWIYLGVTENPTAEYMINGQRVHGRQLSDLLMYRPRRPGESRIDCVRRTMDPNATAFTPEPKHRYVYPLDRAMRRQLAPLAQPYPRRATVAEA